MVSSLYWAWVKTQVCPAFSLPGSARSWFHGWFPAALLSVLGVCTVDLQVPLASLMPVQGRPTNTLIEHYLESAISIAGPLVVSLNVCQMALEVPGRGNEPGVIW